MAEQTITLYAKLTVVVRDSYECRVDPAQFQAAAERVVGGLIGEKVGHTWLGKDGPDIDMLAAGLVSLPEVSTLAQVDYDELMDTVERKRKHNRNDYDNYINTATTDEGRRNANFFKGEADRWQRIQTWLRAVRDVG